MNRNIIDKTTSSNFNMPRSAPAADSLSQARRQQIQEFLQAERLLRKKHVMAGESGSFQLPLSQNPRRSQEAFKIAFEHQPV